MNTENRSGGAKKGQFTWWVIIIIIILAALFIFGFNGDNTDSNMDDDTATTTDDDASTTTSSDESSGVETASPNVESQLVVNDQMAGPTITVSSVTTEEPTWIVVYEDRGGQPGNILGAAIRDEGTYSNISMALLRATTPASQYYVKLHRDNGDREFNHSTDLALLSDSSSGDLTVSFSTLASVGDSDDESDDEEMDDDSMEDEEAESADDDDEETDEDDSSRGVMY